MVIRIADEGDDWSCGIDLPEGIITLSLPSYVWDQFGCVVARLTCHDHLLEIAPLIPWVVNSIAWECTLMAVYNIDPELSDYLDEYQINNLDAYRVFNFRGMFIYYEDRAWEMLNERRDEMNEEKKRKQNKE